MTNKSNLMLKFYFLLSNVVSSIKYSLLLHILLLWKMLHRQKFRFAVFLMAGTAFLSVGLLLSLSFLGCDLWLLLTGDGRGLTLSLWFAGAWVQDDGSGRCGWWLLDLRPLGYVGFGNVGELWFLSSIHLSDLVDLFKWDLASRLLVLLCSVEWIWSRCCHLEVLVALLIGIFVIPLGCLSATLCMKFVFFLARLMFVYFTFWSKWRPPWSRRHLAHHAVMRLLFVMWRIL